MQTMTMSVVVSVLLGWIPLLTTGPMAIAAQSDLVTAIAYDYTKLYEKVSPGVFKIEVDSGHGSGFLIDPRGLIATNHHVVGNTRFLAVKFSKSITVPAEIFSLNSRYDLAIIKVHAKFVEGIQPLALVSEEEEKELREGTPVAAFGSPLTLSFLITQGIISKVEEASLLGDFLINPGNSGGPLVDLSGRVVGVNTFGGEGIGGAVRIGFLRKLLVDIDPNEIASLEVSGVPLRQLPERRYPTELLKLKVMEEEIKEKHRTYGAGDFRVSIYTPVILGQMAARAQLIQAENRYKRRGRKIHDKSYQAVDQIFYEWLRDAEKFLDMGVTVEVTPVINMTGGSRLLQGLGNALAVYTGVTGVMPQNYEFKGEFYDLRIFRDGQEIKPVRPGRRLVEGNLKIPLMSFMDEAYAGRYVYDPSGFMTGNTFEFVVYDAQKPEKPEHKKTFKADSELIRKIRSDFREVLQEGTEYQEASR